MAKKKSKKTNKASAGSNRQGDPRSIYRTPSAEISEPEGWILPWMEQVYARLGPRGWDRKLPKSSLEDVQKLVEERVSKAQSAAKKKGYETLDAEEEFEARRVDSFFEPGPGRSALGKPKRDHWRRVRKEFAARLGGDGAGLKELADFRRPEPGVPGMNNWVPIGPSVVLRGQASGNPPVGGRTTGIAIAPGGLRGYASSADGGVWRTDDGGETWYSTMDGFDQNPTAFGTTSNACGAVAIDPAAPDRVYVGTGEADTWALWGSRILFSLPSYRGVGPIRSDDGGATWIDEPVAAGDPDLEGEAFFALAVDPGDRENVVGATTNGLYQRVSDGSGGWEWRQRRAGSHTSVVVSRSGGVTTFLAAQLGGPVYSSNDGQTWTQVGNDLPADTRRVTLAVQPTDTSVLYAFCSFQSPSDDVPVFRLRRLDGLAGSWKNVSNLPNLGAQADFNLPIAIDPGNANRIYLGGSGVVFGGEWTAAIYRCTVSASGSAYTLANTYIGGRVHADVHVLHLRSDLSTELWAGNDGGLAKRSNATGAGSFVHRNAGFATLCTNFFAQHPTELAVVFCGLQDNGSARYTGEEAWLHVQDGDGGYPVIHWDDPSKVMVYANGTVFVATDGGQGVSSFTASHSPLWQIMAEPIKTTPYNPASPSDADTVAFGAGPSLFITTDFGGSWPLVDTLSQNVFALTFANATRLYAGTTGGEVWRYDLAGGVWTPTRIDNAAGGPLGVTGLITDIEVDPANTGRIWVTFGGIGDWRHVWYYDGAAWSHASGSADGAADALLDVSHNAIVADPNLAGTLYAAADIGVWRSTDSGATWAPMSPGLPDAAVMDLQMHPTERILRAGTHGRGMFEYKLDLPIQADVEVYLRDTSLDVGREPTVNWLPDPETWPVSQVRHYRSRNIKVDPQTATGFQTPTTDIDFVEFNDVIVDHSDGVVTEDPATGTVINRVFVEVHNRGIAPAAQTNVMLLLANSSAGLPDLPMGYTADVVAGNPISTGLWETVGIQTITDLHNHLPQVLGFELPSTLLPPPASLPGQSHHCLLALAHSTQDAFTSTDLDTDQVTIDDRKIAQRNVSVVPYPFSPATGPLGAAWARLELHGGMRYDRESWFAIDARDFPGRVWMVLPPDLDWGKAKGLGKPDKSLSSAWSKRHASDLRGLLERNRFSRSATKQMLEDVQHVGKSPAIPLEERTLTMGPVPIRARTRTPIFLAFELAESALKKRRVYTVEVMELDQKRARIRGGTAYRIFPQKMEK